jgi:hypothetical protein
LEARQLLTGVPVISEFMAVNATTQADEDGAFSDWIEIKNPDPTPLNLAGWHLTDNDNVLDKWQFPAVVLNPGQHFVVYASGKNRFGTGPLGEYHTNFSLSSGGEYLALVRPDGATVAQQFISNSGEYPDQFTDVSYGLDPVDSHETYFLAPTPGAVNSGPTSDDPGQQVFINEIMYHPLGHNPGQEYIELINRGGISVDLSGWTLADGVQYTFAAGTSIPAGGYLAVAANLAAFSAAHPSVTNVVGGWTGELANGGEQIDLRDADGDRVDQVSYADQGDWAVRGRGKLDHNHRGWIWDAQHDGGGYSAELLNVDLTNNNGQNWAASTVRGGTPGAVNSVADANIAPIIRDVRQTPPVPSSTDIVAITARLTDEAASGLAATLFYRIDGAATFSSKPMFDDGAHGDGFAADGVFGARLDPNVAAGDFSRTLTNLDVVEFYVQATDAASNTRTWPAPAEMGPRVVAHWSFEEGVNTTTVDLTGHGHNGSLADGASFAPVGRFGRGVNLDGSDDRVVVESRVTPSPPLGLESFSLATWFRRTGAGIAVSTGTGGVTAEPLVSKGRSLSSDGVLSDVNYFLGLATSGANLVLAADFEEHISAASPGANHPLLGTTAITDNVWHHAAVTYDGNVMRLYLDGNLEGSVTIGRTPNWESTQLAALGSTVSDVGTSQGGFRGQVDETYIFDGAIDTAAINSLRTSNTYAAGPLSQSANALYQIDNATDTAQQPHDRIVMTAAEKAELEAMGSAATCADIMDLDERCDARSDAQMNATFIVSDGVDVETRFNTGVRLRGNNTRVVNAAQNRFNNYRVNIPNDRELDGRSAINLNVRDTESQLAGSVLWTAAGLPAADARAVQLRINGTSQLTAGQAPHYGSYVHIEALDSDFADRHFPDDGNGNMYSAVRDTRPSPDQEADLGYRGPDEDDYRLYYPKDTNGSADDWSDLIALTNTFTNASDPAFATAIAAAIDVPQWLRHIALDALLANNETGLQSGIGDDYALYRRETDGRFVLLPRDLDTLLGRGNSPIGFDDKDIWEATGVPALDRLLKHPDFVPLYLQQIRELAATVLSPAQFNPLLDNALGGFVPQGTIDAMKSFMANRIEWIFTTQISPALTVVSTLPLDSAWSRLRYTNSSTTSLSGQIDAIDTRSVLVNGAAATMSNFTGAWSAASVPLNPGINRVVVEAFDGPAGTGRKIGQTHVDVWYDTGGMTTGITLNIPANATWRYRDNGQLPPPDVEADTWREFDFSDVAWAQGAAQLGYGEGDQTTTIDCGPGAPGNCSPANNLDNNYITSYFRHSFNIAPGDATRFDSLSFNITYDDGAVIFINGVEVDRFNLPAAPAAIGNNTLASGNGENSQSTRVLDLNQPQWANLLRDGANTIAVEVHQDDLDSSDVSFALSLTATETLIGGGGTTIPGGTLTGNITWSPQNGPYHVTGDVTVAAGSTINILPGTSVFFDEGVRMTVNGIINAQGTPHQRIRFSSTPGTDLVPDIRPELPLAPPHWGGLHVSGSDSPLNIISHADFEFAQDEVANDGSIGAVNGAQLVLDDITNFGSHLRWIYARASSLIVRNSVLYDMFDNCDCPAGHPQQMTPVIDNIAEHIKGEGGIPDGGHFIIENNIIGRNRGHNDNIDVDSGNWPDPILQIRNNIFIGTGDEAQDGGGDFIFEGNIVGDFQKDIDNDGTGDSNVISTGDTLPTVAMIVRNQFTNIDHVVNFKTGAYGYVENNTIVNIEPPHLSLPTDPPIRMLDFSAINFLIPNEIDFSGGDPRDWPPGKGAYTAGNIFVDIPQTVFGYIDFVHDDPANYPFLPQVLELHQSLVENSSVLANADGRQGRVFDYVVGDPRFESKEGRDYRLGPGSPAAGTGPNGLDMGALVPEGASISGEPPAVTSSTSATLRIGGPGVLSFVYSLDDGPYSSEITILDPRANIDDPAKVRSVELPLTGLSDGPHFVKVRGRNLAGELQAVLAVSKTWTVASALHKVEINEVLASNVAAVDVGGTHPDLIELYNPGAAPFDLSGMSISDNAAQPRKFIFPAGTVIAAGGYLVLYADSAPGTPGQLHTGFGLKANEGDGVYLFDTLAAGGGLLDSVEYGTQLDDLSIGRVGHNRTWALNQPTFGAANIEQRTGDPRRLRINEWFTSGSYLVAGETHTNDFIELVNADPLPVPLAGLHLTDDIVQRRDRHEIAPLSFIAGGGYGVLTADGDTEGGADHLNFQLAHEQGQIGLYAVDGQTRLDYVIYGPQSAGVSQGRVPDGGAAYQFFGQPTPGLDSSPPSVPQNLRFTLNTPTQVDLAWDASTDPQTGVDHYNIYRNGTLLGTSTTTTFSDTTLVAGNAYQYRVSVVNGIDFESAQSDAIGTGIDISPPSVPGGLTVTEAVAAGSVNLTLTWNASTDAESGVRDYKVFRNGALVGTVTDTTFTDNGVSAANTLEYRVSATNNDNVESEKSPILFVSQLQNGVSQAGAYNGMIDNWISEDDPTEQNGDDNTVNFDGANPNEEIALVKWDVASIPANAIVHRASMVLNVTNNSTGQVYEAYPLLRSWIENQSTFEIAATGVPWETAGARGATDRGAAVAAAIAYNGSVPSRVSFPLSAAGMALVGQWVAGTTANNGLIISDDANDNGVVFSSSEAGTSTNRPLLLIAYTTPPASDPTPPTVPAALSTTDNGATQITLTWNISTDPESGVDHYKIFRDGVQIGTSPSAMFVDPAAVPGVTYSYEVSAVNGSLVEGAKSTPLVTRIFVPMSGRTLQLQTRDSYLPGSPILVRVEIRGADGNPDRSLWDAGVTLASDNPAVTLSATMVRLYNGLGSLLVTPTGNGNFNLSATIGGVATSKALTDLTGAPQTNVSGTLAGASTSWSGIIHVTGDVTVPVGHTLTIQPGTLVLVDGDPTPEGEAGRDIIVQGTLNSLGTAARPVTITAANPAAPWGEIFHDGSAPSQYTYTDITRAGHSPGAGHTGTGPALHTDNSTVTLDHSNITDITGKIGWTTGGTSSSLTFRDSHFARAVMGPEINDTAMLMEDHWTTEMLAIYREDGIIDDNDGIYIHSQEPGQTITMRRFVFARGEDDSIDTLGSTVTIEDAIIRDWDSPLDDSKGISISGGAVDIRRSLIVNTSIGVAAKALGQPASNNTIDRSTIVDNGVAIERTDGPTITFDITNSILRGTTDTIFEGGEPGAVTVNYSNLGEVWPGLGNQTSDPLFVDAAARNYNLQPTSPAIDAGNPAAAPDPDGSRADMGAFPFTHAPPSQYTVNHPPYLQLGNAPLTGQPGSETDQVEILWQTITTGAATDSFVVQYRQLGSIMWLPAGPITTINTGVGTRINHSVTIDGLLFDQDYEYRVQHTSGGFVVGTYQEAFHTRLGAGSPESYTFVAYGDSASGVPPTDFINVQNRINTIDPSMVLLLGDNAYGATGAPMSTWGSHESLDMRFDPSINPATPAYNSSHIEYLAIGNAELNTAGGQASRDNYSVPRNGPVDNAGSGNYFASRPEHNYSFDYGDVHYATFDSSSFFGTPSQPARLMDQLNWLVADMQASTARWKIVYAHDPLIALDQGQNASSPYYQQVLAALRTAGVDLVLVGHSHTYQRSYPLTGQSGGNPTFVLDTDNNYTEGAGLVQVIVGTGGRSLSGGNIAGNAHLARAFTSATTPASEFGFAKIDVVGNVLTLSYIAADDGAVLDAFSITAPAPLVTPGATLPAGNTVWTAAAGPRRVTGNIIIPVGATLTIEPGVQVSFAPGVGLQVNGGRLVAEGTPHRRISLSAPSGSTAAWAGIRFLDTLQDNRLTYVDMSDALSRSDVINVDNSRVTIDHVVWSDINGNILELIDPAIIVNASVFPTVDAGEPIESNSGIPEFGYIILSNNIFGQSLGNSDTVDIEGGYRTGRVLQVFNNVFFGGPDEALDTDLDAHIEGNIFMNNREELGDPEPNGTTSSISTGPFLIDPSDPEVERVPSVYTIKRNLFYNVDQAVGIKEDTFVNFINNTVVGAGVSALNFYDPSRMTDPGRGALVEGNIFWDVNEVFGHVNESENGPNTVVTDLVMNHSLVDNTLPPAVIASLLALGVGNISADPMFVDPQNDFHLLPGSPAIGTGPDGRDMGAYVSRTSATVASVRVRGTSWSPAMLNRLAVDGRGYAVPYAETGANADTLPWSGVNQISITFSDGVVVSQNDLVVTGVNVANYATTAFAYDNLTRTATWTLATPIGNDKVLIVLNDSVLDLAGDPLDGDPAGSYPSGDGLPGGDFRLRFNALAGDVNSTNTVDADDFRAVFDGQFTGASDSLYVPRRDINADGAINIRDWALARDFTGHTLPGNEPAGSPSASVPLAEPVPPAAVVVELAPDLRSARIVRGPAAGTRLSQSRPRLAESTVDQVLATADDSSAMTTGIRVLRARRSASAMKSAQHGLE